MMKKRFLAAVLLSLFAILSNAQALQFIKSDHDPVSSAMGGASSVYSKSAYAAFNNMAAFAFSDDMVDVALSYSDAQPGGTRVRGVNLGGSMCVSDAFGISAAFSGGLGKAYDIVDMDGNKCGRFTPAEYMVSVGASYRFCPYVSVGLNAGYAGTMLADGINYGALVSDIFVMSEFYGARLTLGLSDIGTQISSAGGNRYMLPTSIVAGAGYSADFGSMHKVKVAAESNLWHGGKFSVAVGTSYSFHDFLEVRAGYRYGGRTVIPSYCSAGMGLKIAGVCLDFSYILPVFQNRMSGTWVVGLGFAIGRDDN